MSIKKPVNGYSAPIVYKAFAILEEIAGNQSRLGISDLARKLNMSKGTVHGIIQALIDLEAVTQDYNKKFLLGPALVHFGNRALAGGDIRLLARPFMEELCKEFNETVFLGTFGGQRITIIEKVESPSELKISAPVGTRIPAFAGAAGKVFLAGLADQALRDIMAKPIREFTGNSVTDPGEYMKEIEKVRKQGFATDFQEYIQGVNAVCVPVTGMAGRIVAAIWMVGFAGPFNRERVSLAATAMLRAAEKINRMLNP